MVLARDADVAGHQDAAPPWRVPRALSARLRLRILMLSLRGSVRGSWRHRGPRRRGDALERVRVEVLFRREERAVRPAEPGGKEERPVLVLLEERNRLRGDLAIRVFLIRCRRRIGGYACAVRLLRCDPARSSMRNVSQTTVGPWCRALDVPREWLPLHCDAAAQGRT